MILSLKKNFSFLIYASLNIIDKFLAYVAPLLILKFLGNNFLYNQIELIYSISIIFNVFLDFGLRGHFVYSYRFYDSKADHINDHLKSYNSLFFIYIGAVLILLIFIKYSYPEIFLLSCLIFIRIIYLFIINFFRFFFRFYSKINYFFLLTIPVNIVTIFLIIYFNFFDFKYVLIYFFVSQFLLILIYFIIFSFKSNSIIHFKLALRVLKSSINYYWPIILSTACSLLIMNFGKIYFFYNMSENDMTKFSFIIRFLLIIQLFHATFSSFNLKKNYQENEKKINKKIFVKYFIGLVFSILFVNLLYPNTQFFFGIGYNFDLVYLFLVIYITTWCLSSYLEQFLGKFNKNIFIMYLQIASLLFYFLPFIFLKDINIQNISFLMVISSSFYLFGILFFLKKEDIKIK